MAGYLTKLRTKIDLAWLYENVLDGGNAKDERAKVFTDVLTEGTAIDQANKVWFDTRSLTTTTPDPIDLSGGVTDAFGNVLSFTKIKLLMIHNKSTTEADIISVGAGSNPIVSLWGATGDIAKVGPGGVLLMYNPSLAGYAVTDNIGEVLNVVSASGSLTYDILVVGI